MSFWNHRVVKKEYKNDLNELECVFGIHECYYSEKESESYGYTENPVEVSASSIENLKWMLEKMLKCLELPIIEDENNERIIQ